MCYPGAVSIVAAANQIEAMRQAQEQARMSAMAYRSMGEAALQEAMYMSRPAPKDNCPSCGSGKYTLKLSGYFCDHCGNNR